MLYCGRFAPSPTGELHVGSLLTALVGWLRARQAGGRWLLRIDNIDPPREAAGAIAAIVAELHRLGLVADGPTLFQSTRDAAYQKALDQLRDGGQAFACWCSRTDLAAHGGLHHDGRCTAGPDRAHAPAWRLRVPDTVIAFDDILQGPLQQNLREVAGDFVIRRADGLWAYQLACVIDDAAQGITEVVRGIDLIDSTPRQIHLQRLLGLPTPRYLHIPMLTDTAGHKLSKSCAARPLSEQSAPHVLRAALTHLLADSHPPADADVEAMLAFAIRHADIDRLTDRQRIPVSD